MLTSLPRRACAFLFFLTVALAFGALPAARAQNLGNAFHVPVSTEVPGTTMRSPLSNIEQGAQVFIYSGNQAGGGGNAANQTGGSLFFKVQGSPAPYQSVALAFHAEIGNNKYWRAALNTASFRPGDVIVYYLQINYSDRANTFVYGTDTTTTTTGTESTAAANPYRFALNPKLTVNGVNGDYTTTHLFISEPVGSGGPQISVVFEVGENVVDPTTVQVFTNLNRRDLATQVFNGEEEGIQPPSGDLIGTNDAHYYKAFAMTKTAAGRYELTLPAEKTGAYRLTARYRQPGSGTWIYYTAGGKRDHAVVLSPTNARDIVLYELNTLTQNATGTLFSQRGTFADLYEAGKRNLDYVKSLGCNYLWFQPIHPNGVDGRQIDPTTGQPYEVGSPYAVKNFFDVMPLMGRGNTRASALQEFQAFVGAADAKGVGVMLDAPFNHTAYDAELASLGVNLFGPENSGWNATDLIRNRELRFFSRKNNYFDRASYFNSFADTNIAVAPDRDDFGKFGDTYDVFYGSYSSLVNQNPQDNGAYNNEQDTFYYGDTDWTGTDFFRNGQPQNVTKNVWKYFSEYLIHWLDQTGGTAANLATNPDAGIDALRADFGQGLPPQAWEYIINKTRARKWKFVFMTESLDGGAVTYRSNRHFDILNENIVFPFQAAGSTGDYRGIFDNRRNAYGQGLVLLNSTSHDEENYVDPFQALIRYMVSGSVDGVPLIFYGQENGVSRTFGFDAYEANFGKQIPHFKKFNSLQPILAPPNRTFGLDQLFPVYAAIGQARQFSEALRSSNRYYLNQIGGSVQTKIFSVAKYSLANASPGVSDVVFAFVNLDRDNDQQGNFDINITQNGSNLFGIKRGRVYNVRNVAAYTAQNPNRRDAYLIPGNATGDQLLDNGFFVNVKRVPTSNGEWSSAPFEAQYLKLYDLTPPPVNTAPFSAKSYSLGRNVTFSWPAVSDPDGGISGYVLKVGTTPGGNDVFDANVGNVTSYTVNASNLPFGQRLYATIIAVNNAGVLGGSSAASTGTIVVDPAADDDGDGESNAAEDLAGTDLFSANSVLRVVSATRETPGGAVTVTWASVPSRSYVVQAATDLTQGFTDLSGILPASAGATTSYTDAGTAGGKKFYRVRVAAAP